MSANELSLLWKLRADNSQSKSVIAETKAQVASLRQTFGPELAQTVSVANKAFSEIGNNLNVFVSQRIPLVGGAFVRITENLKGFNSETKNADKVIDSVAKSIQSMATESGKSTSQISSFLARFIQIEGQAKRGAAAIDFLGATTATKLIPQLEKTGAELASVAGESAAAGTAIVGMALPIALVVLAFAALAIGAGLAAKEIFSLAKGAAEFQGRMFDLAQQTGVEVETLSALEVVARTTGGEIGNLTQALVSFQRKLEDAQDPTSKTAETFNKFRIQTSDTENALRETFTALAAMPTGFAQTSAAAELFGARGGKQILAILKETNGDLDATIKRFRELGILISTDDARAADIFNDELELLNLQLRGLTATASRELIPAFVEIIKATEELVRAVRPLASAFSTLAGPVIRVTSDSLKALGIVVASVTRDYEALARAIKEAQEATEIKPLGVPAPAPVSLPGKPSATQTAGEDVTNSEAVLAELKRRAAAKNQILNEAFEQGRIDRAKQAEGIIADNKKILNADKARIDALLTQKEQEIKALDEAQRNRGEVVSRDSEAYRAVNVAVAKLQQEQLDKQNEFDVTSRALRAKAAQERADSLRGQISNETNIILKEYDRQIQETEAAISRGAQQESAGLTLIEQIEQAKIQIRREGLEKQKQIGFLTVEDQKSINSEIQALDQEADLLQSQQRDRRLARDKAAADRSRDLKLQDLDTTLELQRIAAERSIATQEALADLRIKSEEDAARAILKIRLDLIDQESTAIQAKLDAAKSITNADERTRTEAELNAQLKILAEQRKNIQADGNRAIDEGRQEDLDNERRFADELEDIKERIRDIELDTAAEVIQLMRLHFANRKDIIRAQRDLELQEEEDRHTRKTESIRRQQAEVDEEIRILESHLKALKIGTTEEIEEHDRLIESLEKLRIKRAELNAQQAAEDSRSTTRKRRVTDQADLDLKEVDPLENLKIDGDKIKEFAQTIQDSVVPLNQILTDSFQQVAQAIGQVVSNWVLLGETGPAVGRKILAQALANIAAEAAVNAIKELAVGFALLAVGDFAGAGSAFTSAAIWGSIGGVAAIAGRKVAGDLFKQKPAGGSDSRSSGPTDLNPITRGRNQAQPPVVIHVDIKHEEGVIVRTWSDDYGNGGITRQTMERDGR